MNHSSRGLYSVTRRVDLSTMLAITTSYALLFAVMKSFSNALDFTRVDLTNYFAIAAGFITCVAISQAVLFGGNSPRKASLLVGGIFALVLLMIFDSGLLRNLLYTIVFRVVMVALVGAFFGYLVGTCAGGVFLIADCLQKGLHRLFAANDSKGMLDSQLPD